ncbi:MAG TPA: class I SAM-dependent rRNA methyltransferase [Ktedonobacterales bacterium]|jgi:23S rRNA (cytosine1962-C5)-methyltransferase|nr:class I SAM-dependent rRNA methyltransferase [Ktedonobacterales bacterium]
MTTRVKATVPRPASPYPLLRLRQGRDYTLSQGHPWVFSGAFLDLPRELPAGSVVDVTTHDGHWLARGHLNAANSLAFRALTRDRDELIDEDFYFRRIQRAQRLRALLPADVTAYRLIHAEADGLPGLIVDRYDHWLVAQFHTAGAEAQREMIIAALSGALGYGVVEGIATRDDIRARAREGLVVGVPAVAWGLVPDEIEIRELGVRYLVAPLTGQKTGFFLDQRDKRARIAELAPHGAALLNLFAYTGGFALSALARNPALRTVNVDSSAPALVQARRNYALNGIEVEEPRHRFVVSEVNAWLQRASEEGERFDLLVVDPPAFAKNLNQRDRALRAYEQLNALALRTLAPGGLLLTCSCSGGVNADEFEGAVRQALAREHRAARLISSFGPSLDHPTLPGFSEDRYLKALLLSVD